MSEQIVVTFNLKAVINKEKTRVLFAEVENDFVDVLFSFLILPLGCIIDVMDKHYGDKTPHVIGSFNTLYYGLANLVWFQYMLYGIRPSILKPESAYLFPFLNKKVPGFQPHHTMLHNLYEAYFLVHRIFTQKKTSFIIRDDLRIVPNVNGSIVQTLNSVGVDMSDIDGAETRNLTFGLNEIMDFLKGLLISSQPLTDVVLGGCTLVKYETGISLHHIEKEATSNSNKMYDLKIMLQKSTNKLLFAEAGKDFVSFIATVLTIPLGLVDLHLGGDTCFKNIDSLYCSMIDLVDHKYFGGTDMKDRLMKIETFSYDYIKEIAANLLDAEGSRMHMVTDDLTVTHLCVSSSTLSLLNQMKISSSDVEEVDLHIGLKEARNILKASLASTSALSDGLL